MRNFNPERAAELVKFLENKESMLASLWLTALILEAQLEPCCQDQCVENCDHCSISYNDSIVALRQILSDASTAPFEQAYGVLFPRFVCIASKAVAQIQFAPKESQDGNTGSEPSSEQSPEENSGGSKLSRRSRGDDR
jgi:hypothetical protein